MRKASKLIMIFISLLLLNIFYGCSRYSNRRLQPKSNVSYPKFKSAEKIAWSEKRLSDMIPYKIDIVSSEDWDWIEKRMKARKNLRAHPRFTHKKIKKETEIEIWVIEKHKIRSRKYNIDKAISLTTKIGKEQKIVSLPLKHTSVNAEITGFIASVSVEQQFYNPYDTKIEAIYTFPLPQNAAISDFVMKIGNRQIRGMIREKEEAKRIYQRAKSQGYTASLLTQRRPNVFTQKVANIEPLKQIDIEISYFNSLPLRDGEYEFVFPTVVGPRYNPTGSKDPIGHSNAASLHNTNTGTTINYAKQVNNFVSMNITLNAGVSINKIFSSSHKIVVKKTSPAKAQISLSKEVAYPDKDFILRFSTFKKSVRPYFVNQTTDKGKFFSIVVQPPANLQDIEKSPQELIFVIDCSGSMGGWPLYYAKTAVKRCLKKLDSKDTFQIIQFSNNASKLGYQPLLATKANVRKGIDYLDTLTSGGGTEMLEGIRAALNYQRSEGRERIITFMTDGFIGNEQKILSVIKKDLKGARIFSFGVGSSVNRYLLEEMAKLGKGGVAFISQNSKWEKKVDAFYNRISHPALKDIQIDWNGLKVSDVYPKKMPDLFLGRPVVLIGKYTGELPAGIMLKGWVKNGPINHVIKIKPLQKGKGIAKIWAREKLRRLSIDRFEDDSREKKKEMIHFSQKFKVLCDLTSFIAVDSLKRTKGQKGVSVKVAVPVPAGVSYDTTENYNE